MPTPGSQFKPTQKLRKVNWSKLPANKLYNSKANSVWKNPNEVMLSVNTQALEELFSAKAAATPKSKNKEGDRQGSESKKSDKASCFDVPLLLHAHVLTCIAFHHQSVCSSLHWPTCLFGYCRTCVLQGVHVEIIILPDSGYRCIAV